MLNLTPDLKSIVLVGLTRKGKNRIHELGRDWIVMGESDTVLFSKDKGPWLLIRPTGFFRDDDKFWRWIHKTNDVNFKIESSIQRKRIEPLGSSDVFQAGPLCEETPIEPSKAPTK